MEPNDKQPSDIESSATHGTIQADLTGVTALVTGAGRGIGEAVATMLATAGAEVMITARSEARLRSVSDSISSRGGTAHVVPADLTNNAHIERLAAEVRRRFEHLDILVNNAGIAESYSLLDTTAETWDRHMAINARAPFLLSTQLVDVLERSRDGVIVNIGSVVDHKGYVNQGAYTASKHALSGFTKVLAKELHPRGIRVHLLSPGGVSTEMIREVRPDIDPERLMTPQAVARSILFLVTMGGNAIADEIRLRRRDSEPWK